MSSTLNLFNVQSFVFIESLKTPVPKHIRVSKIMNCVLWFTIYCTSLSAFVGKYIEFITDCKTSPFLYLLIFLCMCVCVCLVLSFLSKDLVSALKGLTTELQQCEPLYSIKYHHKIFQCALKKFEDEKMLCKNDQSSKGSQMEAKLFRFFFFVQSWMLTKHYEETVRGKTCYNFTSR